jgi:hypothetical protein
MPFTSRNEGKKCGQYALDGSPVRYRPPSHRTPFNATKRGSTCVLLTCRLTSACPWLTEPAFVADAYENLGGDCSVSSCRRCSPRHGMPCNSINEGSKRASGVSGRSSGKCLLGPISRGCLQCVRRTRRGEKFSSTVGAPKNAMSSAAVQVGPAGRYSYSSPRHRMPFDSSNEGFKRVWMT